MTWAGTYNAATGVRQLFKNGALVMTDNAGVNAYQGPSHLIIGDNGNAQDDFNGQIDFVRFYSGVRSAGDILTDAGSETPGAVRYGTWWSPCDEIINPHESVVLTGATNTKTECISHLALTMERLEHQAPG